MRKIIFEYNENTNLIYITIKYYFCPSLSLSLTLSRSLVLHGAKIVIGDTVSTTIELFNHATNNTSECHCNFHYFIVIITFRYTNARRRALYLERNGNPRKME